MTRQATYNAKQVEAGDPCPVQNLHHHFSRIVGQDPRNEGRFDRSSAVGTAWFFDDYPVVGGPELTAAEAPATPWAFVPYSLGARLA